MRIIREYQYGLSTTEIEPFIAILLSFLRILLLKVFVSRRNSSGKKKRK